MPNKEKYSPRKTAKRVEWKAADYVREDWSPADVVEFLEMRALGYNGSLREILCTAAAQLRDAGKEIERIENEVVRLEEQVNTALATGPTA